ncbi:glycoside hydrolase family 47 protein [bacterium]|nr:MAG: glycoside hydrolase family 47 protein [bacterium]
MPKTLVLILLCILIISCNSDFSRLHGQEDGDSTLAREVRNEFMHSWKAYKQYAWGHDGLRPVSKTSYDWYGVPFYMTAVDALDTMILMGFTEEADSTREYIATHLSFDKDVYVKNFEFTIRLLGGLLSSYQLTGDRRLLNLADDLGTRLLPAFKTPTGMPWVYVNLKTGAVRDSISNPAEIGTLLVEFGTLSELTGKPIYYNTVKYALLQLYDARSEIDLVGQGINVLTGEWTDPSSHIGGAIDSYYEYLLKSARLFDDYGCSLMWQTSIKAVNQYLADTTSTGLWYGVADMNSGKRTHSITGALDAFFPAVLVLAKDMERATKLQQSFLAMWDNQGIEPEQFDYKAMKVTSPPYHLNPEIMESAYYLYAATGDRKYLAMGKHFLEGLKTYCRTDAGYAELKNVNTKEKLDRMESYFLAETLKYLYLLFAPRDTLDLMEITFNTEAHPLRKTW